MLVISPNTQAFVDGLNAKFTDYEFAVRPGRKYDKVTQKYKSNSQVMVHAFVDSEGNVYKPAGWAAPAKGVRYTNVTSALANSDPYGSYLYADHK